MQASLRNGAYGLFVLVIAICSAGSAAAQELPTDEPWRFAEVRLGVLAHDVRFAGGVEGGVDLNGEVTSSTFVNPAWTAGAPQWAQWILHPRAHFGIEPNLNGKTSQLYAGFTWTATLVRDAFRLNDGLELGLMVGPSINNGEHSPQGPGVKALGSNILFHLGIELSYRITQHIAVGLYFDHSSNGGFARYNASLNDAGLRVAYRF